ncbi:hypothetical protein HJFPF1_07208 [Paramyrothecium foliicola]|nr:hypothetical protein HJFPF1_07208 [Paramyrothecium foliicola]
MAYDRDLVVKCITRHYELLVEMGSFESSMVQYPPPEGWDDEMLIVDILRHYERSDKVIDLLRHLPYVKPSGGPDTRYVHLDTRSLSYLRGQNAFSTTTPGHTGCMGLMGLMPDDYESPPSLVSLSCLDGTSGTMWLLDTESGLFYREGEAGERERPGYLVTACEDQDQEQDQPRILNSRPHDLQKYFDFLHDEYRRLDFLPARLSWGWQIVFRMWPDGQTWQRLYREHGWPDSFRRQEFIEAAENQPPSEGQNQEP